MFSIKKLALHEKQIACHFLLTLKHAGASGMAWRGAAFPGGSSIGLQQAAPASYPRLTMVPDVLHILVRTDSFHALGWRTHAGSSREPPAAV
jgi:hypothetical protein